MEPVRSPPPDTELGWASTLLPGPKMSLRLDCSNSGLPQPAAVARWQRLAGSLVEGVLESQGGFQSKGEGVSGGDLPPLHSREACSRSRTLNVRKICQFGL